MPNSAFKFPALSAGYAASFPQPSLSPRDAALGLTSNELTNNAACWIVFWRDFLVSPAQFVVLPQRIPKEAFFEEMASLEDEAFGSEDPRSFSSRLRAGRQHLAGLFREMHEAGPTRGREQLVILGMALRLGMTEFVEEQLGRLAFSEATLQGRILGMQLSAHIARCLNRNEAGDFDRVKSLATAALAGAEAWDPWVRMSMLSQLVVAHFRYRKLFEGSVGTDQGWWKPVVEELYRLCNGCRPNHFAEQYILSTAWRGLAYWNDAPESDFSTRGLVLSVELAKELVATNEWEQLVRKDLLLTATQSLAKWKMFKKAPAEDIAALMTSLRELDPQDSTPYAESGFYHLSIGQHAVALTHFEQAIRLGPPAVAMHMFFAGRCHQLMGAWNRALEHYTESSTLDSQALSPLYGRVEVLLELGDRDGARREAQGILNNPDLSEQLDDNERTYLQNALL